MRISDWSSDVCSSDLRTAGRHRRTDTAEYRPRDLDQRPDRRDRDHASSEEANIGAENRIRQRLGIELGRSSSRDSVCQYVENSVVAVTFKKNIKHQSRSTYIRT